MNKEPLQSNEALEIFIGLVARFLILSERIEKLNFDADAIEELIAETQRQRNALAQIPVPPEEEEEKARRLAVLDENIASSRQMLDELRRQAE